MGGEECEALWVVFMTFVKDGVQVFGGNGGFDAVEEFVNEGMSL